MGLVQFMKWKKYNFFGGIWGYVTLGGGVSYLLGDLAFGGMSHWGGGCHIWGDLAMTTFNRQGGREVGTPPTTPLPRCDCGVLEMTTYNIHYLFVYQFTFV